MAQMRGVEFSTCSWLALKKFWILEYLGFYMFEWQILSLQPHCKMSVDKYGPVENKTEMDDKLTLKTKSFCSRPMNMNIKFQKYFSASVGWRSLKAHLGTPRQRASARSIPIPPVCLILCWQEGLHPNNACYSKLQGPTLARGLGLSRCQAAGHPQGLPMLLCQGMYWLCLSVPKGETITLHLLAFTNFCP